MGQGFSVCDLCNRDQNTESIENITYLHHGNVRTTQPNPFTTSPKSEKFHNWYKEL